MITETLLIKPKYMDNFLPVTAGNLVHIPANHMHPIPYLMTVNHPILVSVEFVNPCCHHPILKNLRSDANTCILKDGLVNTF